MKLLKCTLLLLVCLVFASSCKKSIVKDTIAGSKITFKVDGVSKVLSGDAQVNVALYKDYNTVQVLGNVNGSEAITVMISDYHGVGEYVDDEIVGVYLTSTQNPDENSYVNTAGLVKVTSVTDTYIKGEFQFTAENGFGVVKVISEGTFQSKILSL